MKLTGSDYTEQLETEKMMLRHSVRHLMRFVMTLSVDGHIPADHKAEADAAYETAQTAMDWIREWDRRQRLAFEAAPDGGKGRVA